MNIAMEMHDSWVEQVIKSEDGTGHIVFKGYVYKAEGSLDGSKISGWQRVRFTFTDMRTEGPPIPVDEYASHGSFTVDGIEDPWGITLQVKRTGSIRLSMCLSEAFETHIVTASSALLEVEGEFEAETEWDAEGNPHRLMGRSTFEI